MTPANNELEQYLKKRNILFIHFLWKIGHIIEKRMIYLRMDKTNWSFLSREVLLGTIWVLSLETVHEEAIGNTFYRIFF